MGARAKSEVLVIVPCGLSKIWDKNPNAGPTLAKNAYKGSPFKLNRQYAERFGTKWIILSAKYGFILPDNEIPGPYEGQTWASGFSPGFFAMAFCWRTASLDCSICLAPRPIKSEALLFEIIGVLKTKRTRHTTSPMLTFLKACGRLEYPNPTREQGAIPQVPHLRIGLRLVVFKSPLA